MVFLFLGPEVEKFHYEIYENIFLEKYENIFQGKFFCFWGLGAGKCAKYPQYSLLILVPFKPEF